jgi:exopolyphosphatase/guanosine-5'-triphosphate,3'-diphosphate pyrophosphatase
MQYYAGIDIGTNTLLLLITSRDQEGNLHIIRDEHRIARLGEGINQTGIISQKAIQRAILILEEYASYISEYTSISVKAIATSAMRDALNTAEVQLILEQSLGFPISVISGIEEAALTFLGSKENYENPVIIDIGGGSTEIIQLVDNKELCASIDIGAVRLTDTFIKQLPIAEDALQQSKKNINEMLQGISVPFNSTIIATAGTPTTLAAIDLQLLDLSSTLIHGHELSIEKVNNMSNYLLHSDLVTILRIPGVHPQRADILPAGALILSEILQYIQAKSCIVSKKGLRYGIVQSIIDSPLSS